MSPTQLPNHFLTATLRRFCLVVFLLTQSLITLAQMEINSCGFDSLHQQRLRTDSLYRMQMEQVRQRPMDKAGVDMNTVYTIPVVFVVYHLGEAVSTGSNVSDQELMDALNWLNQAYRATNPPFPAYPGTDTRIQFVLAQHTPNTICQPFNGIVRVNASGVPEYTTRGMNFFGDSVEGNLRKLTPQYSLYGVQSGFVTIHVVHKMNFAVGVARSGKDMFVDRRYLGAITHEMGHVLYLKHTFEGSSPVSNNTYSCPINNNPSIDGDGIADTDPHRPDDRCQQGTTHSITNAPGDLLAPFFTIL